MATQQQQKKSTDVATREASGSDVATIGKSTGLTARMAAKFGIEPTMFLTTLKQTAFRQRGKSGAPAVEVSNEQMAMLLHIAEKYDLDPFLKQLYAFQAEGGISPIVPIDGWLAIINRHRQMESMEIETAAPGTDQDDYWCAVTIQRKDRKKPTRIEEWLKECYRDTDPWNSHPKRMLRHKAIIQCARVAFGYSGIFDPDEEERIYANAIDVTPRPPAGKPETRAPQAKQIPADQPEVQRITLDQATTIADKLKEEGVALDRFLAHVGLASIEDIDARSYASAFEAIDELSRKA